MQKEQYTLKETYKRDLQKRPAKQAHILSTVCIAQRQRCGMQNEQYVLKEFYERDVKKRPRYD